MGSESTRRAWMRPALAKCGDNLFVDPVANGLYNSRLDYVALRVDGDLYYDITLQIARQFRTRHGRIREYNRISNVNFMAFDRSVNHGAER